MPKFFYNFAPSDFRIGRLHISLFPILGYEWKYSVGRFSCRKTWHKFIG